MRSQDWVPSFLQTKFGSEEIDPRKKSSVISQFKSKPVMDSTSRRSMESKSSTKSEVSKISSNIEESTDNPDASNTICSVRIDRTSDSGSSFENADSPLSLDKSCGLNVSSNVQISFEINEDRFKGNTVAPASCSIFGEGRRISSLGESRSVCGSSFFSKSAESYPNSENASVGHSLSNIYSGSSNLYTGTGKNGSRQIRCQSREENSSSKNKYSDYQRAIDEEERARDRWATNSDAATERRNLLGK